MNTAAERYDVIVVGAGLAGLQCAGCLAGRGLRILLIDAKRSLTSRVHTTGIFVRRTLEDFALPADCLGPVVRHVSLYSPRLRRLDLESEADEFRVGRMGPLYLELLDRCGRSGVEWLPGTRYLGSSMAGHTVHVRLARKGRSHVLRTRFLVGADGADSRVARDLGLDVNRRHVVGVEDVMHGVPLRGPPRFHCVLDPVLAPGYLAWVVEDGEETHVGVGGYAARFRPLEALRSFRTKLNGVVELGAGTRVERRGGRIPVGGVLHRIANRNGLLVGDAAGAVSPLTAGGLDPCIRLSSVAAELIAEYLATGDPAALSPYDGAWLRSRFRTRLWLRRLHATMRHPAILEAACAGLRLAPGRRLARHIFFGRGSFPDIAPRSGSVEAGSALGAYEPSIRFAGASAGLSNHAK